MTLPYAEVIGDPIAQSKSPAIHGFWLAKLGIAAEYRRAHIRPEGLAAYIAERRADADWRGCNVTMPHKQAIIPLLYRLDATAARIGAVNTVVCEADGTLTGRNTDAPGFIEPLLKAHAMPTRAVVIGAGGAARAIVTALVDAGVAVTIAARHPAEAAALLNDLAPGNAHHVIDLADVAQPTTAPAFDLVVNASPLGMVGNPPQVFDLTHATPDAIVYDIVTAPLVTPLIACARGLGLSTVDGLSMLIGQAAVAFEHFFGASPLRDDGDAELRALLTA